MAAAQAAEAAARSCHLASLAAATDCAGDVGGSDNCQGDSSGMNSHSSLESDSGTAGSCHSEGSSSRSGSSSSTEGQQPAVQGDTVIGKESKLTVSNSSSSSSGEAVFDILLRAFKNVR